MTLLLSKRKQETPKTIDPGRITDTKFEIYYEKMLNWLTDQDERYGAATQMRLTGELMSSLNNIYKENNGNCINDFRKAKIQDEVDEAFRLWLENLVKLYPETKKRNYRAWLEFNGSVLEIRYNENLTKMISGVDEVIMANLSPSMKEFKDWVKNYSRKEMENLR